MWDDRSGNSGKAPWQDLFFPQDVALTTDILFQKSKYVLLGEYLWRLVKKNPDLFVIFFKIWWVFWLLLVSTRVILFHFKATTGKKNPKSGSPGSRANCGKPQERSHIMQNSPQFFLTTVSLSCPINYHRLGNLTVTKVVPLKQGGGGKQRANYVVLYCVVWTVCASAGWKNYSNNKCCPLTQTTCIISKK